MTGSRRGESRGDFHKHLGVTYAKPTRKSFKRIAAAAAGGGTPETSSRVQDDDQEDWDSQRWCRGIEGRKVESQSPLYEAYGVGFCKEQNSFFLGLRILFEETVVKGYLSKVCRTGDSLEVV